MIVTYRSLLALAFAVGVYLLYKYAPDTKQFMIGFGLTFATPILCAAIEATRRACVSKDAIAAVRESSWREGYEDGRRAVRPTVVSMPEKIALRKVSE